MTVLPFKPGAQGGVCNICDRETGNLAKHRPPCARRHGRPATSVNLSPEDERLVIRAGTHAVHEHLLSSGLRWQRNVNDLSVARLLYQIEKGVKIVPSSTGRSWASLTPMPQQRPSLTAVVMESLRLKVVTLSVERTAASSYLSYLQAAPTHARSATNPEGPVCRQHVAGTIRWRLLDWNDLAYVDCQGCLDRPARSVFRP